MTTSEWISLLKEEGVKNVEYVKKICGDDCCDK